MFQRMAKPEMLAFRYPQYSLPTLTGPNMNTGDRTIVIMGAAGDTNKRPTLPGECTETFKETNEECGIEADDTQGSNFNFTFDQDLNNSRAYARARKRSSTWSIASSTVHTMSWSYLSNLSLAEISDLSVIGLPISAQEFWNGHHFVLTSAELAPRHEKTDALAANKFVRGRDGSIFRDGGRFLEVRRAPILHSGVPSAGGSLSLATYQQSREPAATVDANRSDSKRIMLLGTTSSGLR